MRRFALLLPLIAGAIGCDSDPAHWRLRPGQAAIAIEDHARQPFMVLDVPGPDDPGTTAVLDPGTRVAVEADSEQCFHCFRIGEMAEQVDHRDVRITVTDGAQKGRTGTILRYRLRPVE